MSMVFVLAILGIAHAGEWSSSPIEPRYEFDFTAYTVPKKHLRVGVANLDYGLLKNAQVGTVPLLWVLRVVNVHGKVTAIQSPKFDLSLQGGWFYFSPPGPYTLMATPLDATASWLLSEHLSIHGGLAVERFAVDGSIRVEELGQALEDVAGVDLGDALDEVLHDAGSVYAGAQAALYEAHLAADWRFNRRDSLILQYRGFYHFKGSLEAGYETEDENLTLATVAKVQDTVTLGTATISWQFTWPHWRLRMGLGVSNAVPVWNSFVQAWDLAYVF